MPKQLRSAIRLVAIIMLMAILAYMGAATYHYYYVLRWDTDIGGAGSYLQSRNYDKAIASLQDALRISPRLGQRNYTHANAWTHEHLGEAYRRKGEFDRAAAEYRTALSIDDRPSAQDGLRLALAHNRS